MSSILLIAKGPSAARWEEFAGSYDDLAKVNNVGEIVTRPAKYTFCTHLNNEVRACLSGSEFVVCPELECNEFPVSTKLITYRDSACSGETFVMQERILSGGICHHHTTSGALHWLSKFGKYGRVGILGVDGGRGTVAGVTSFDTEFKGIAQISNVDFLDEWKDIDQRLTGILAKVYGTRFTWHC